MKSRKDGKQKIVVSLIILILFIMTIIPTTLLADKKYETQDFPTELILKWMTDTWNVTWSGNSSSAAIFNPIPTYCNSSGVRNTTVEVNLSVNGTHFIERINVSIGNLTNNENHWYHNADNITLYISGDNVSWEILQYDAGNGMGIFPTDGGNLTINQTIWGVFLGNPWDYFGQEGVIVQNCSIYLRFRCNLSIHLNDGEYKYGYFRNETDNPWNVYIVNGTEIYDTDTFTAQLRNGLEPMTGCCLDVNKTVWNGTEWVKWYRNTTVGQEVMFNISFHNCAGDITDNMSVVDTGYDALWEYIPTSAKIKYPGEPWRKLTANETAIDNATCESPKNQQITFNIPKENLTNFTYCNYIYIHYNRTVNNQNYSRNEVGVYVCPFEFEWFDSLCYNTSVCYVNEWFNTSILCNCENPEYTKWVVSEHINRSCVGNGCYDEKWFEYETEFDRWCAHNSSLDDFGSVSWEWVYRYDNTDGNGTDINGLSYAIVNNSNINRSMSLLRMRYNITDYNMFITEEPFVGLIYSYTNNSWFDMILFRYSATDMLSKYNVFLLSKHGNDLVNTLDNTVITDVNDCHEYYDTSWTTDTGLVPYYFDPSTIWDSWGGIWVKTLYNEHSGRLQSKLWDINSTQRFALDFEPAGWVVNETLNNIKYNDSKCFGLVVWNPEPTTKFYADFDFIEEWRLNYSRDPKANESQLENHSAFGSDGIPLMYFPTHQYFPNHFDLRDNFTLNCYFPYLAGSLTTQQFVDCSSCFYKEYADLFNMESRSFIKTELTNFYDQQDNIYYYVTTLTNVSNERGYNNSLYIQIEDCTDGSEDSFDGALVVIDVDNDMLWGDNDLALYWFDTGMGGRYVVYNGTTVKYIGSLSAPEPDMDIYFTIDFTNTSLSWIDTGASLYPPIHRYSPHRVYTVEIPIYYLEKGTVDSGNYLNVNETFGLNIMTTNNDYSSSSAWSGWNENNETYYVGNDNDAFSIWSFFMNCSDFGECVDFEDGFWNGVTSTNMQFWGHGIIGNESGYLVESRFEINATKTANVTIINDLTKDNIVNYTINITNIGDNEVVTVKVNDTLPENIVYINCSLPKANVTNPSDNIYIFNVTNALETGKSIEFNITVNITLHAYGNGTNITNNAYCYGDSGANYLASCNITYGTNKAPIITRAYPYTNRTITEINLLLTDMNATVVDPNGDNMDIYFYTNKTINLNVTGNYVSIWRLIGTHAVSPNGTYETNQTFNMDDDNNKTKWRWGTTSYWWSVNATDGKAWTNETFYYITDLSRYDVQSPLGVVSAADAQKVWSRVGLDYDGLYDVQVPYSVISGADAQRVWNQL